LVVSGSTQVVLFVAVGALLCGVFRKVENKLLEMLNMRGRHKHKWDSLRQVLAEKVVYDDNNIRVWMAPDGSGQGLIYYAKQAQVRQGAWGQPATPPTPCLF
jgi:hypothetical protein